MRQVLIRCRDVLSAEERRCINVKTYHAFAMDLLRAHGQLLTGRQARFWFPRQERLAKAQFEENWHTEQARLASEEGIYCFDLFAQSGAELLTKAKCVAELIADRYPVVILDEFQDTNDAQWSLVRGLSTGSRLIVLADPDQRIFEYDKTVDPKRLDQLREHLSPNEFDFGCENHRSPDAGVLPFADAVLRNRPLPETDDVAMAGYDTWAFEQRMHAAVLWMLRTLRKRAVGPSQHCRIGANQSVRNPNICDLGR